MINANELMVGDWVMWKNRQVQIARVGGIVYSFGHVDVTIAHCNDENLLETHDIKSVSPIPLTEEILEKNFPDPNKSKWTVDAFPASQIGSEPLAVIKREED